MKRYISSALLASMSMLSFVHAQDSNTSSVEVLSEVSVVDKSLYRNRTNSIKPVLAYDSGFFDKYEPRTVGEMLKFLPGVAFQGDVGEYDFVKLRGMASGYTQVLINGNRVPGTEADGSASLDLIPAEMVERIEIIRSSSASNDSAGMAGTINIILKEATSSAKFGYRFGSSFHSNGKASTAKKDAMDGSNGEALYGDAAVTHDKFKGFGYLSYTDVVGETAFTFSANVDDRYVAKDKVTIVKDSNKNLAEYENEYDNRDTLTTSLYGKVVTPVLGNDELSIQANYFRVDRLEEQWEMQYKDYNTSTKKWTADNAEHQTMEIHKESYNTQAAYEYNLDKHKIKFFNAFDMLSYSLVDKEVTKGTTNFADTKDIDAWIEQAKTDASKEAKGDSIDTQDIQYNAKLSDVFMPTDASSFEFGVDFMTKNRSTEQKEFEVEDAEKTDITLDNGTYKLTQNRYDAFLEANFEIDENQRIGAGGRAEVTHLMSTSQKGVKSSNLFYTVSPSVHYTANVSEFDMIRASFAQTVKRPTMDELVPFVSRDNPRDDDELRGNPNLKPEVAQGFDIGYERSFKEAGVIGFNVFYRGITDLVEKVSTGEATGNGNGRVHEVKNQGKAVLYGFEFDSSFPLAFIDMPEVSIFANYAYLGSRVTDPFSGKIRRFNDQPEYVYNVGFNHDIKKLGLSYGLNWQQRGESIAESADETEVTTYGANVEFFASYDIAKNMKLRFTIDNMLDTTVDEAMTVYDSAADKLAGTVKEYETQSERAGARYMLTLSGSF